jgi:CBS domain containing-hemolysin-like protein
VIPLLLTVVLLLANGFFVAWEFGVVGSRREKIEPLAVSGSKRAQAALSGMADLNMQLAGAQLGITMASLGIGFVSEPALAGWLEHLVEGRIDIPVGVIHTVAFVIALTVVVFFHMVIGEMVPKNATLADPERTLMWTAVPAKAYLTLFRPLVWSLNELSNAGIRLFGVEPRDELSAVHTAEELAVMLGESREEGYIEEFAHELLTGVLDFSARDAAFVMVPRDQVVTAPRSATVAEITQIMVDSGHSRVPLVDHDIDSVIGFVHSKDLLALGPDEIDRPLPLRLVRRMLVVPRERSLEDLLVSMRSARVHFALVVDGDRRTAGVATLEDLLEELVGDILDESDRVRAPWSMPPGATPTIAADPNTDTSTGSDADNPRPPVAPEG